MVDRSTNLTPEEIKFAQEHVSRAMVALMSAGAATDYVAASRSAWASALAILSVDLNEIDTRPKSRPYWMRPLGKRPWM